LTAKPRLEADRAELARFVDATFRYADDGTHAMLRTFAEGSNEVLGSVRVPLSGTGLEPLVDHAAYQATKAANAARPAVFAPPVATFVGTRARERDLGNGLVMTVEADFAPTTARRNLEYLLGSATVVVASGGQWTDPDTGAVEDKLHLHWRCPEPSRSGPEHSILKQARALTCAFVGGDATAISLVHPLRWAGSWHRKNEPRLTRIIDLRPDVEIEPAEVIELLQPLVPAQRRNRRAPSGTPLPPQLTDEDLLALGETIANADREWADWNRLGMALFAASGGSEAGLASFDLFSRQSAKYDAAETRHRWEHYRQCPPDRLGPGTLVYEARQAD
jgi:Primase C terminal 2 (PriCT-2)